MPRQRLQVDSGISPAGLKPVASPVDTFVKTDEGRKLEQLAQGLAQLSPALGRFSDTLAKRSAEENFAAGQKKARELAQSAKSFKEAIRSGMITPNQSPWFMAGLREQFGRLAADRMNFEMMVAAAQDETLQTTTDPADFDAFAQKFTQQWQETNLNEEDRDAHFEQGFGSKTDAYLADQQRQFAAQLAGRVVRFAGDGHFAEVLNSILVEQGRPVDVTAMGASITGLNDAAVARGMGGDLVNQMTIDAVVAAAKLYNDDSILHILEHTRGGKADNRGNRPFLSNTRYGAKAIEDAQNEIASDNQAQNSRNYEAQQRAKQGEVDTIIGQAVAALDQSRDPHSVDLKALRAAMTAVAPEKVPLLHQLQDAWSDRTLTDDPLQVASAFRRVYTPNEGEHATSLEDASALLADRGISVTTYRGLVNEIIQRDTTGGTNRFVNDPLYKEGRSQIRRMFQVEFGGIGDNPIMAQRAEEAVDEFSMRYTQWRNGPGKDASNTEALQWVHDARIEVFRAKSESRTIQEFDKLPEANMNGPQRPDPAKQLVTDISNIRFLEAEIEQIGQGRRGAFSPQALSILQYAGIPPTKEAVAAFIQQQRKLIPIFIPPDSIPN
jgi:hypothetical protein